MIQTLLGARVSRLDCGNVQRPYSFEIYPPDSTSNAEYQVDSMAAPNLASLSSLITEEQQLYDWLFKVQSCMNIQHV